MSGALGELQLNAPLDTTNNSHWSLGFKTGSATLDSNIILHDLRKDCAATLKGVCIITSPR